MTLLFREAIKNATLFTPAKDLILFRQTADTLEVCGGDSNLIAGIISTIPVEDTDVGEQPEGPERLFDPIIASDRYVPCSVVKKIIREHPTDTVRNIAFSIGLERLPNIENSDKVYHFRLLREILNETKGTPGVACSATFGSDKLGKLRFLNPSGPISLEMHTVDTVKVMRFADEQANYAGMFTALFQDDE